MRIFKKAGISLHNTDALTLLAQLPNDSVDLIATDPPYYKVKQDEWDNQWRSQVDFFAWLDCILSEFSRVLKPSGSIYLFSGPHLATQVDLAVSQHFDMLNHIVWCKPTGRHLGCRKESLRKYFPQTEHILFAESKKLLPTPRRGVRYFSVNKHVPYTNVWHFKPVAWYSGKHPCEKPLDLMRHIVLASSLPGGLVLDTFSGSGSTAIACRDLGRKFVGCEMGPAEFDGAVKRLSAK